MPGATVDAERAGVEKVLHDTASLDEVTDEPQHDAETTRTREACAIDQRKALAEQERDARFAVDSETSAHDRLHAG